MPWNAGAAGKVILAYLPEPEREAILAGSSFEQFTPFTVTDPDELRRILQQICEAGYATSAGDLDPDAIGISAPVLEAGHRVAGAISVGAPTSRMSETERARVIDLVRRGAAAISRGLGYDGGSLNGSLQAMEVETR